MQLLTLTTISGLLWEISISPLKRKKIWVFIPNSIMIGMYLILMDVKNVRVLGQDGTWSFLDAIVFPKNKKMSLETSYVLKNEINVDTKDGKPRNFGVLTGKGISDHLPIVAEIKIN